MLDLILDLDQAIDIADLNGILTEEFIRGRFRHGYPDRLAFLFLQGLQLLERFVQSQPCLKQQTFQVALLLKGSRVTHGQTLRIVDVELVLQLLQRRAFLAQALLILAIIVLQVFESNEVFRLFALGHLLHVGVGDGRDVDLHQQRGAAGARQPAGPGDRRIDGLRQPPHRLRGPQGRPAGRRERGTDRTPGR